MLRWLAVYDVADNRRRLRLAGVLDDFGDRVQNSVFEMLLEQDELPLVKERIAEAINPLEDKVRLYPLCDACGKKVVDFGPFERKAFDEPEVIVV